MKTKTINLSYPHLNRNGTVDNPDYLYRIEKVTNSTAYSPTNYLTKKEVNELCESKDWTVNIAPVK